MDFTNTETKSLLFIWENQKKALDTINKSLKDGSFNTVGPKGEAPPSQSGQMNLAFAIAADAELTKRGVKH